MKKKLFDLSSILFVFICVFNYVLVDFMLLLLWELNYIIVEFDLVEEKYMVFYLLITFGFLNLKDQKNVLDF